MDRALKHKIYVAVVADLGLKDVEITAKTGRNKSVLSLYKKDKLSVPQPFLEQICNLYNVDILAYQTKFIKDNINDRLKSKK